MSKEQIEEMAMTPLDILANDINQHCQDLAENYCGDTHCVACLANALYNAGYRKQSDGEWVFHKDGSGTCNQCGTTQKNIWDMDNYQSYCGHCGAKMKGGEHE